jgi:hypothetical protein
MIEPSLQTVLRKVEGPEGGGQDEAFEMVGFVSYYDQSNDKYLCEYEDGGEEAFTVTELKAVLMPDEVIHHQKPCQ